MKSGGSTPKARRRQRDRPSLPLREERTPALRQHPVMSPPPLLLAGASSGFGGVGGVGGFLPLPLRDEARARTRSAVHDPLGGEE
jgi:hypothetical protein